MEHREIKFRAWNLERKEMKQPSVNMLVCSYSGGAYWQFGFDAPEPMLFVLMQYTGLKDKNGKEIYEGDVLEKNYGRLECLMVGDKEKLAERWRVEFFRGQFIMNRVGVGYSERLSDYAEERAIVGNIYENPELLTK